MTHYTELRCKTNFSFLTGASHAEELAVRAAELGYAALAVTDVNTLAGVVRRFYREGVRVRALHRAYADVLQVGSLSRLVPLPLFALLAAGVVIAPRIAAACLALLAAYLAAFLVASRGVPARLRDRLAGALLFTVANLGFGAGYAREALRGRSEIMLEPQRPS